MLLDEHHIRTEETADDAPKDIAIWKALVQMCLILAVFFAVTFGLLVALRMN